MDYRKQAEEKVESAVILAGYKPSDLQSILGCNYAGTAAANAGDEHGDLLIIKRGREWRAANRVRLRYSDPVEVWAKQISEDFSKDGN